MIKIERVDEDGRPTDSADWTYRRGLFHDWPGDDGRLPCAIMESVRSGSDGPLVALGSNEDVEMYLTQEMCLRLSELLLYFYQHGELPDGDE